MAGPGPAAAKPEFWWGAILGSARTHASTGEVWGAIWAQAISTSTPLPAGMFQAVNQMRSLATSYVVAAERLARSDPADAITSRVMAPYIGARSLTAQALAPRFDVRFDITYRGPEGDVTATRSWKGLTSLPGTIQELYDMVDVQAGLDSTEYGWDMAGVTAVEIAVM